MLSAVTGLPPAPPPPSLLPKAKWWSEGWPTSSAAAAASERPGGRKQSQAGRFFSLSRLPLNRRWQRDTPFDEGREGGGGEGRKLRRWGGSSAIDVKEGARPIASARAPPMF